MEKGLIIRRHLTDHTMISKKEGSYIGSFLLKLPSKGRMLEIGTGAGDSTLFFALLKPKWTIYTIDLFDILPFSKIAKGRIRGKLYSPNKGDVRRMVEKWENAGAKNIVPILANSRDVRWELLIDALFIDGDHYYEGVKSDFDRFSPFVKKDGVVMFHDYGSDAYYAQVKEFVDKEVRPKWKVQKRGIVAVAWRK